MNLKDLDYQRYLNANAFINEGLIRRNADDYRPDEEKKRTRKEHMLAFLKHLDHPERSFKPIHIGGTSGKGSIAIMTAQILHAAKINTGLHISPYLQVATEKLWVNEELASIEEYEALIEWIKPFAQDHKGPDIPMHGMASVAIFLEHFKRKKVEYGVVEVGVGGRSDLTNIFDTSIAAISNIGYDHLKTLGPTLEDIAWHKVGIIKEKSTVFIHDKGRPQDTILKNAAKKQVKEVNATLYTISHHKNYRVLPPAKKGYARLDYRGSRLNMSNIELSLLGSFQAENAALAIAIAECDPRVDEEAIRKGLKSARLPARLEEIPSTITGNVPVIIDGAHNPDKIMALLSALKEHPHKKLHLIFGALASKSFAPQALKLFQLADRISFTQPHVYAKTPQDYNDLLNEHRRLSSIPAQGFLHVEEALNDAQKRAHKDDMILVTGSIYLAGEARSVYYPQKKILANQRFWV